MFAIIPLLIATTSVVCVEYYMFTSTGGPVYEAFLMILKEHYQDWVFGFLSVLFIGFLLADLSSEKSLGHNMLVLIGIIFVFVSLFYLVPMKQYPPVITTLILDTNFFEKEGVFKTHKETVSNVYHTPKPNPGQIFWELGVRDGIVFCLTYFLLR